MRPHDKDRPHDDDRQFCISIPAAPEFQSGYGGIGRRNAVFARTADHHVIAAADLRDCWVRLRIHDHERRPIARRPANIHAAAAASAIPLGSLQATAGHSDVTTWPNA
jgi:hypothetical protein